MNKSIISDDIYLYKGLTVASLLMSLYFQPLSFPRSTILDVMGRSTPSPTAWDSITSSPIGYVSPPPRRPKNSKNYLVKLTDCLLLT